MVRSASPYDFNRAIEEARSLSNESRTSLALARSQLTRLRENVESLYAEAGRHKDFDPGDERPQ